MNLNEKVAKRIKQIRKEQNFSQREVSEFLGRHTNKSTLDLENGSVRIKLDHIEALAILFKVSVPYIMGLTDKKMNCKH